MPTTDSGNLSIDVHLAGDLISFTTGLIVTLLFLVLALRAVRLPGTPIANLALGLCSLMFNLGGLIKSAVAVGLVALPVDSPNWPVLMMGGGMWLWPVPVLEIWRSSVSRPWQRIGCRFFQIVASLAAAAFVLLAVAPHAPLSIGFTYTEVVDVLKQLFSVYGFALLGFGTAMLVQNRPASRAVWLGFVMILLGIFGASFALFLHHTLKLGPSFDTFFAVASKKGALLVLFGSFFLFARFRFADLFIRHSFRLLLASWLAMALVAQSQAPCWRELAMRTSSPLAMQLFCASLVAALLLFCFTLADRAMGRFLGRWLFQVPDYSETGQRLADSLGALHHETEIAAAAEDSVRALLELEAARLLPFSELPASPRLAPLALGESVELGPCDHTRPALPLDSVELVVPVRAHGQTSHVLLVAPGRTRRALVSHEVGFLRRVAAQIGQRFDTLRAERELIERRSREAVLLQQVTEAELRALRAQINPHFLFNSLNTVADLIVTDPSRAELMTLRLAQVFRHVLAHSARPVTSIREEIDFVRTYLFIEEARFGDRLRVDIDIAPEVAAQKIPSLILQPVVENALKHGLAPKLGPGLLRIGAMVQKEHVCLTVEDDGVGPGHAQPARIASTELRVLASTTPRTHGVGLKNVAARLHTLYRDRAGIRLEPRAAGGSLVTILIPWAATDASA